MKRKRNQTRKRVVTAGVIMAVIAIAALIVINQRPSAPIVKGDPTEYFTYTNLGVMLETRAPDNTWIRVKELFFDLTPVKGNATNVHVDPGGNTDPLDANLYWEQIANQTTINVDALLKNGVQINRNAQGYYPYKIHVVSDQADGNVFLNLTSNDLVGS